MVHIILYIVSQDLCHSLVFWQYLCTMLVFIIMYRDISLGRCMIYGDIKYDLLINFELGPAFFISGPQVMFINRYII